MIPWRWIGEFITGKQIVFLSCSAYMAAISGYGKPELRGGLEY
jgi:hypothetical protein